MLPSRCEHFVRLPLLHQHLIVYMLALLVLLLVHLLLQHFLRTPLWTALICIMLDVVRLT